jgi:hypothetical protein
MSANMKLEDPPQVGGWEERGQSIRGPQVTNKKASNITII